MDQRSESNLKLGESSAFPSQQCWSSALSLKHSGIEGQVVQEGKGKEGHGVFKESAVLF